jgi:hypothetical protein
MSEDDSRRVETILVVGAEGGSITLEGQRDAAGVWRFRVARNECVLGDLLGEELGATSSWESWEAALAELDRYPWPRLWPIRVHADFAGAIHNAVAANEHGGAGQVRRWRKLLEQEKQ